MRIATWNVNSVRARLPRLLPWLRETRPDVVCLQETKCVDEEFPREELEELGYQAEVYGQKTYNGVAILSRLPMEDVVRGFYPDEEAAGHRAIGATIAGCMILNLYVVNGQKVGAERYAFKLDWLAELAAFVRERYPMNERVILCGDFNITFDDRDVWDPEGWRERILCSTPEREALRGVMACGLHDALRKFTEAGDIYTWWDFRTRGFRRNRGLRIDHFLMSRPALDACVGVEVDVAARDGAKPSDHAPVVAVMELAGD
jgi:exodeoxyribonuclease-3